MVDNFIISVRWNGLEKLINELNHMEKRFDDILLEELTQYGLHVEEAAKRLVHHDEGNLEDSINFDKAVKVRADTYQLLGGSNLEYALRRHEEPGRGVGTIAKPSYRGYMPGPKYLENAMKATEEDFDRMLEIALERIIGEV